MATFTPAQRAADAEPGVRRIDGDDLRWALREGWRDFLDKRGDLILVGLLYPLIGIVAAAVTVNQALLPLFFPVVAGVSLLGPAAASGFYELAKRREEGDDPSWRHFFDPLRDERRSGLVSLTSGLVVLFVAWLMVAWAVYQVTLGRLAPIGIGGFLDALFTTREGWMLIVFGNLAGAVLAIVTLTLTVVAFPMAVDHPVDPAVAVRTSIRAVQANSGAMLRWGGWVAALLVLGAVPLFIGLAAVLPVLGYSTWHLYTRLVER